MGLLDLIFGKKERWDVLEHSTQRRTEKQSRREARREAKRINKETGDIVLYMKYEKKENR